MIDPLELEARRKLYEFIKANPGLHFREVARRLDLAIGSLDYHSRYLEGAGLIERREGQKKLCLFSAGIDEESMVLLPVLRSIQSRRILMALLAAEEVSHGALARELGVSKGTMSFHLERLKDAGVIKEEKKGGKTVLLAADPNAIARVLITHQRSFFDKVVDRFVALWSRRV